jgi:hypothetical protein
MRHEPLLNTNNIPLDFEALPADAIILDEKQIERAIQLSSQAEQEAKQWQIYLNALGLFGFAQWLEESALKLVVNIHHCSIYHQQFSDINAIFNLELNKFKLALITLGTFISETIAIPKIVIDYPENTAHFYVLVEVQEENEQVMIQAFLRYDTLVQNLRTANLQPDKEGNYKIPLTWWERDLDCLLLYLSYLEPTAIVLPKTQQVKQVINAGLWLQDKIDELAQSLSWVLLPALAEASVSWRSPTQEIQEILTQLQRTGTQIPTAARAAYQDLQLDDNKVRLYAVTWHTVSENNSPEWKLLLILGAQPGYHVPDGLKLQVSDDTGILVEQILNRDSHDVYLYARIVGTWDERFIVTISITNGATLTLPAFAFRPEPSK